MKITCKVIESLLPMYVDDLASEDSVLLVEEHLKECESCRNKMKELQEGDISHDIDEFATSDTLMKIKKTYHWGVINITFIIFLFLTLFGFMVTTGLSSSILNPDNPTQLLGVFLLGGTFIFSVCLIIFRLFGKKFSSNKKDLINQITLVTSIILLNSIFMATSIDYSFMSNDRILSFRFETMLLIFSTIFCGFILNHLYKLSFTMIDDSYISNMVVFTLFTLGVIIFEKYRIFAGVFGWGLGNYWEYSSTLTLLISLTVLVLGVKVHNYDRQKPTQIITFEYKVLQSILLILGVFIQFLSVYIYNMKFLDNPFDESYVANILGMVGIANILTGIASLIFAFTLYYIIKKRQYIMVFIMMQTIALFFDKVINIDILLGNIDNPEYIPLSIYWVFYTTLAITLIYVVKLVKSKK